MLKESGKYGSDGFRCATERQMRRFRKEWLVSVNSPISMSLGPICLIWFKMNTTIKSRVVWISRGTTCFLDHVRTGEIMSISQEGRILISKFRTYPPMVDLKFDDESWRLSLWIGESSISLWCPGCRQIETSFQFEFRISLRPGHTYFGSCMHYSFQIIYYSSQITSSYYSENINSFQYQRTDNSRTFLLFMYISLEVVPAPNLSQGA